MKISCSKPFLLCGALLFFLDQRGFYLLVFAGVLLHEAGHLLAILMMRCHVERLELQLSGLNIGYTEGTISYQQDVLIALAGPLANLLGAGILMTVYAFRPTEQMYLAIGIQILLAGFNLLPALPMDGGRILQALAARRWDPGRGAMLLKLTTALMAAVLLGVGLYACKAPWHNPTLLITAVFLLFGLLKEKN